MAHFLEVIKQSPASLLSNEVLESKEALEVVKTYFDDVIQLHRDAEGKAAGSMLDEIVVDGLDANQVWWQAKMVLDKVGVDLMTQIAELRGAVGAADDEDMGEDASGEELSGSELDDVEDDAAESDEEVEGSDADGASEEADSEEADSEEEQSLHAGLEEDGSDGAQDEAGDDSEERGAAAAEATQGRSSAKEDKYGLNDEFFDIEEFNKQTLAAENPETEEAQEEEQDIDYFDDIPSEEDEEALYYNDFFDQPNAGKGSAAAADREGEESGADSAYEDAMDSAKLDLFESEGEDDEDDVRDAQTTKKLSTFERQQLEIRKQIEELEKEAVAEKKWALKGEVKAKDRPDDALLTEDLEFDRTAKPVPVITNEATETLEAMIRRRIKNAEFDDLPRRVINDISLHSKKPEIELSDVKSSKSLAEIYENEYKGISEDTAVSEELQKAHDEISELYKDLVYKLDALSSASFIPKPPQKSLEVRVQGATISMEDAQPLTMSSASTLAPQEIYAAGKAENSDEIALKNGVVMARAELTREDKQRLRRANKRKRAHQLANKSQQLQKKSKKADVIDTLSRAKNVTIIDKKGEQRDVKGNVKSTHPKNINLKL
ncbi:ACR031Wp [Eremothecium gossypii ATCC 10895]|uniref:U3 small nucleolar ribonucleoprotein protein MPP10 n=1 Tax=Eremothecium gossypii (strain ATCC 10895 / CBS 109.51 / FGSC 9923 / NRRL Y-1056) TaxID=284811 RepID=Q75C85_EREGS|nr:ACR031Wp [Eremothecium gossypii ATCC 10895]AAS51258.1 ACR031Wp [Eremothecium gossypii ATCC 10895]AEY95549.1 FACR031Wp [Eremothecium gossypii FDAG1]